MLMGLEPYKTQIKIEPVQYVENLKPEKISLSSSLDGLIRMKPRIITRSNTKKQLREIFILFFTILFCFIHYESIKPIFI